MVYTKTNFKFLSVHIKICFHHSYQYQASLGGTYIEHPQGHVEALKGHSFEKQNISNILKLLSFH